MAILTPSQLTSASNATYFDNTSGSITPTSVRSLNDNWISSSILVSQTSSMNVLSASYAGTASVLLGSIQSSSYALSASYAGTASVLLGSVVSASFALSSSFASTASFALNAGGTIDTGSFATTGSNTFVGSQTITSAGNTDVNIESSGGGQTNMYFKGDNSNFAAFGAFRINNNGQFGGSGSINFTVKDNELVFGATQGFRLGVTNTIGNGIEGGSVQINVPSGSQQLQLTGSLNVTNGIIVNQGALITGSARLRPEYAATEFPFTINQVSDGTSTGANIIAVRNNAAGSTGSFTISGSSNIFVAPSGPSNTAVINGNQFGFNGRGNIVQTTTISLVSGSSSNPTKVLPTITNTLIGNNIQTTDNRPNTTTTPLTIGNSNIGALLTYTTSTGSMTLNNLFNLGNTTLTVTGSNGITKNLGSTMIVGSSTINVDSPSGSTVALGLLLAGSNNTLLSSGSNFSFSNASILGGQLALTGSITAPLGSTFIGRLNAQDSTAILQNTVFGVGTGTLSVRRTSLHVSSSGLTTVRDGLIVSSSLELTGSLNIESGSGDLFVYGNKQFNGAEYLSTQTQSGSSAVSQSVTFNTTGVQYGVSLVDSTKITVANSGTYNIQFSAQVLADTGADDVWIWFKKNGTNIANSATRIALANNEENVITVNILEEAAASDYFEIVWESANGDAVLLAEAAAGNYPAIPSIIATVTQVR